ncbi:hypothetical protein [Parvibaculum sp.]|uniref:hypothetical protein n=1 Tax=Parvibaculum sp. TaxID=2024848 RepID=UPI0026076EE7|nr:hypothetical protein [Parvibaculum sp.]MCW5727253.1 hypothetical protein [Parvibaculum sp.]
MSKRQDVTIRLSAEGQAQLIASLRAVGGEGERMARQIERAGVPASRGLLAVNAASRGLQGNMQGLAGRAGVLGTALSALGPIGIGVAAGLGAMALGISRAFRIAREGMEFGDELDTASKRLRIGTEALQEYRNALKIFGDADADFDRGAKVLLERVGEANRGTGEGVILFRRLGIEIRDAKAELKGVDALLPEIADKMQALGSEAERTDVAGKLFGRGAGTSFINLLQEGSDGLARMRGEMRDAGLVMDAELVRRYAEASDQSEILTAAIGVNLKSAFADFPNGLNASLQFMRDWSEALAKGFDALRGPESRTSTGLKEAIAAIDVELETIKRQIPEWEEAGGRLNRARIAVATARQDELVARRAGMQSALDARAALPPPPGGAGDTGGDTRSAQEIANAERDARVLEQLTRQVENFGNARQQAIDNALSRLSAGAGAEQRAEVERLAGAMFDMTANQKELNEALAAEQAIMKEGASVRAAMATEQEKLAAETARLNGLLAAGAIDLETHTRATKRATEQYDAAARANKELSADLARLSIDALSTGRAFTNMSDVAVEALQRILNKMLEMLAFKPLEDAFSGFLSSTFSGVFHGGRTPGAPAAGGPGRHVDPALFAFAPRFHAGRMPGLGPDELPAIIDRREGIFTPHQMNNADGLFRALAGMAGGSRAVEINLRVETSGGGVETRERPNASGGVDIELLLGQVDAHLAGGIVNNRSRTGEAIERRYGLDPARGLQR